MNKSAFIQSLTALILAIYSGAGALQAQAGPMEEMLGKEPMIAQNQPAAPGGNPAQPAAPAGDGTTPQPTAQPQTSRDLSGFAETPWMTQFSQVKETFKNLATSETAAEKVEIVMLEKNKYILVSRNGIRYRYNFYKTPYNVVKLYNHDITEEDYDQQEAQLYQVRVIIPFIDSPSIKSKIVSRYGQNTNSTVNEKTKMGADVWELNGGFLFQWYEPYKKHAYTRTLDFLSADMTKKILKEFEDYFDAAEKEILQKLIVK